MTKARYLESIRDLDADVYMLGKRVPDVTKNGFTRLALEGIGSIYDLARDAMHRDPVLRLGRDERPLAHHVRDRHAAGDGLPPPPAAVRGQGAPRGPHRGR